MAESANEAFNIGSSVSCKTCFQEELQGEVLAFDPNVKILTLKAASTNGRSSLCDIHMINLSYVSHVKVLREAAASPLPTLPSLNLSKLSTRAKKSIDDKQRLIEAVQHGVPPLGQNLFLHILKTIEDIKWSGPNILVLGQVLIIPPYSLEHVRDKDGKENNGKTLSYVKKLVEKFYNDQPSVSLNNGTRVAEVHPVSQ